MKLIDRIFWLPLWRIYQRFLTWRRGYDPKDL
jgi:hypothetical protein